jgi:hypothetical protein
LNRSFRTVSLRTIQRIEKGQKTSVETAKSLASVFELSSYHFLLAESSEPTKVANERSTPPGRCQRKKANISPPFRYGGKVRTKEIEAAVPVLLSMSLAVIFGLYDGGLDIHLAGGLINPNAIRILSILTLSAVLLILLAIRRKEKCDKYTLPENFHLKRRGKGIDSYTSRYAIETNAMMVGEFRKDGRSRRMIRHEKTPYHNHMIGFGESGSGHHLVMLFQCFPMLCTQRGGIVVIDRQDTYIVHHIAGLLKYIGRSNDLVVYHSKQVDSWEDDDWKAIHTDNRIVVFILDETKEKESADDIVLRVVENSMLNAPFFNSTRSRFREKVSVD